MADVSKRLDALEDELKLLKGEIKTTLLDIRSVIMKADSPFGEVAVVRRVADRPEAAVSAAVARADNRAQSPAATPATPGVAPGWTGVPGSQSPASGQGPWAGAQQEAQARPGVVGGGLRASSSAGVYPSADPGHRGPDASPEAPAPPQRGPDQGAEAGEERRRAPRWPGLDHPLGARMAGTRQGVSPQAPRGRSRDSRLREHLDGGRPRGVAAFGWMERDAYQDSRSWDGDAPELLGNSEGLGNVNLLSNLIHWTAMARAKLGDEKLSQLLDFYVGSVYRSPALKAMVDRILEMLDNAPPQSQASLADGGPAQACMDLLHQLHGVLLGHAAAAVDWGQLWQERQVDSAES